MTIKIKSSKLQLCLLALLFFSCSFCLNRLFADEKCSVVFLNPGGVDDIFFKPLTDFTKAAAKDLGVELEVIYCNRDRIQFVNNAKKLLLRKSLPKYLLLINEQNLGAKILQQADAVGIKVFLFNEDLVEKEKKEFGKPEMVYKNWIGSFIPDDEQAGYLLGSALINQAIKLNLHDEEGIINVVAISGAKRTLSATSREQGLKRAVREHKNIRIKQIIPGYWEKEKAKIIATGVLNRYANIHIIWCASDGMADGVVEGVTKYGKIIGKDILTGGVDWTDIGIKQVKNGNFVATVGGCELDGGLSLIMIFDYDKGIPLKNKIMRKNFTILTKNNLNKYQRVLNQECWSNVNFKSLSKYYNHNLKDYNFTINNIFK